MSRSLLSANIRASSACCPGRAHHALGSCALATLERRLLSCQRPAPAAALGRWPAPPPCPEDPLDSRTPAPIQPGSRPSPIVHSNEDSNQEFLPLCRVRLNVESLNNLLVIKSALVLISFFLSGHVIVNSRSLIRFPREPKMAQMPIFVRRLVRVAVGRFSRHFVGSWS
jgi:hypothetical protein